MQRHAYSASEYNETQLRREFLDPFFAALGWDVANRSGCAEAYKDVVHEPTLRIGASVRAPDYCFRIGGTRKFFVEAKKPSVDLASDPGPAFQLRRYAWSATLPLSILTDFQEFAVYDTRIRPHPSDRASTARVLYMRYPEYSQRWDELEGLFSRTAVLRGAFDAFAGSSPRKKGTARVDESFLDELNVWRELLAKDLASGSPRMTEAMLNDAVQLTLNRLLFLRIAEDRGMEQYGTLREATHSGDAGRNMAKLFGRAHNKYNSGLFVPGRASCRTRIPERAVKSIVGRMYYPQSPYEFSVMPLDVLGHAYEQFLGKHLRLTPTRRVRIEEKPLVRKAGGVFYTPDVVVAFIIRVVFAGALDGRTTSRPLRILDPACGSGSFLTSAFDALLRNRSGAPGAAPSRTAGIEDTSSSPLGVSEKKRLLTTHLYGVDIDPHAVEVAKLSLLLRVVDGESGASLKAAYDSSNEKALPDLSPNIKCGNSLVASDYFGLRLTASAEETCSVNAFDWQTAFPDVFQGEDPGFDVIVANPPYVSLQSGFLAPALLEYLQSHYESFDGIADLFAMFVERALGLLSEHGVCGMIVPTTLLMNRSFQRLRKLLLKKATLTHVIDLGDGVFRDAVVPTCIIVFRKGLATASSVELGRNVRALAANDYDRRLVSQDVLARAKDFAINVAGDGRAEALASRLQQTCVLLESLLNVKEGIKTGDDDRFLSDRPFVRDSFPVLKGRDIERYAADPIRFIHYDRERLDRPQTPEHFLVPEKLLIRRVGERLVATYDDQQLFCVHTLYTVRPKSPGVRLKMLLGFLNSRLMTLLFRTANPQKGKVFPEVRIFSLNALPFPANVEPELASDIEQHVDALLACAAEHSRTSTPQQHDAMSSRFATIDSRLEKLVWRAYGLTLDEEALLACTSCSSDDTPSPAHGSSRTRNAVSAVVH
ncbi:Eco57I restriction-modification methylase domain-containing protein [Anaeromyxobacter dehalogenans]|nr:N-6 DNA methylase [Anaeromyxobacter dehalogenans]